MDRTEKIVVDRERRRNIRKARRALRDAERQRDGKGCAMIVLAMGWTLIVCGGLLAVSVMFLIRSATH